MRCARLIFIVLLATIARSIASAQGTTSDADAVLPWNNLSVTRVHTTFQSIAGLPGVDTVAGSDAADAYGGSFTVDLPFAVHLFGTTYPAGHHLRVSVAGFVGLDDPTSGNWPYTLTPDPGRYHLLMPYWTDLKTVSGTGEGIYDRTDIDSASTFYDSTFTIEWSVRTMSAPSGSGRFQLKLTQVPGTTFGGTPVIPNAFTTVEFDYDPAGTLARSTRSGSYGAAVGIKAIGQPRGIPPPPAPGTDNSDYLIPTDPGAGLSLTSITRLPTRIPYTGGDPTPDWYANATATPSAYFHYDTPDSGYRMKPVETDNLMIGLPPPSPVVTVMSSGSLVFHLRNAGRLGEIDVPHTEIIKRGGTVVYTHTDSVPSLPGSAVAPITIPLQTGSPGEYHVIAYSSVPADPYHGNDTATVTYWVESQHDAMTTGISLPLLDDSTGLTLYPTGASIPITATVANTGSLASQIVAGYIVRDTAGAAVAGGTDTIGMSLPAGFSTSHSFSPCTITTPGFYYIDVWSHASSDAVATNDTLHSIPSHDWFPHGLDPNARGLRPIPFHVVYPFELAAGRPAAYAHRPFTDDTVIGATPVVEMFANNGVTTASNVEVHAMIADSSDSTVYDETDTLSTIPNTPRPVVHSFADFTPPASGRYCVTVWIRRDSRDSVAANDTTRWCFTAIVDSCATCAGRGAGGLSELERPAGGPPSAAGRRYEPRAEPVESASIDMTGERRTRGPVTVSGTPAREAERNDRYTKR